MNYNDEISKKTRNKEKENFKELNNREKQHRNKVAVIIIILINIFVYWLNHK
jgi:dipeptide/tripeptide permease